MPGRNAPRKAKSNVKSYKQPKVVINDFEAPKKDMFQFKEIDLKNNCPENWKEETHK